MKFIANKVFTDREDIRERLKIALTNLCSKDSQKKIISLYGAGGQGKTELCKHFKSNLILPFENNVVYSSINLDNAKYKNDVDALEAIRRQLGDKFKKKFITFDIALIKYFSLTPGYERIDKIRYNYLFQFESPILNDSIDIANELASDIPGIRFIWNRLKGHFQKKYPDYLKELSSVREIFDEYPIDEMEEEEIQKALPIFLAHDLSNIIKKDKKNRKIIVLIDTYEKLWKDKSNKTGYGANLIDQWVRDFYNEFDGGLLLIISGRDKLKWAQFSSVFENEIEEHYVGRLSDQDCDYYLKQIPIHEPNIRNRIVKSSLGLPFFLDLQVDIYKRIKEKNIPMDEDFFCKEEDKGQIIQRFLQHVGEVEENILKTLAIASKVDWERFDILEEKFFPSVKSFDEITSRSYFELLEESSKTYRMHDLLRSRLIRDINLMDNHKFLKINRVLIDFVEQKLKDYRKNKDYVGSFDLLFREMLEYQMNVSHTKAANYILEQYEDLWENYKYQLLEESLQLLEISSYNNYNQDSEITILNLNLSYVYYQVLLKRGKYFESIDIVKRMYSFFKSDRKFINDIQEELLFDKDKISYDLAECCLETNDYIEAIRIALSLNSEYLLNNNFRKIGRFDLAESIVWNIYINENEGITKNFTDSILFNYVANALHSSGRYDEAVQFYERSLDLVSKEDRESLIISLYCIAKGHSKIKIDLSNHYLKEMLEISEGYFRNNHPYLILAKKLLIENNLKSNKAISKDFSKDIEDVFSESFKANPYDPKTFEIGLIYVKILFERERIQGEKLFQYIVKLIVFKYGEYFTVLIPFLHFAIENSIEVGTISPNIWIEDIRKINEFQIRTSGFTKKILQIEELENLRSFLKSKISLPKENEAYKLRTFDTPCFKEFFLIQIEYPRYSLYAFTNFDKLHFLSGTNSLFYSSLKDYLIFDKEYLSYYVRLFFDSTIGSHGRFILLENEDDFYWSTPSIFPKGLDENLRSSIKPLVLMEHNEEQIIFHTDSLFFSGTLFSLDIVVKKNGIISLEKAKPLISIPIEYELIFPINDYKHKLDFFYNTIENNHNNLFGPKISQTLKSLKNFSKTPFTIEELEKTEIPDDYLEKLLKTIKVGVSILAYDLPFSNIYKLIKIYDAEKDSLQLFFSNFNDIEIILDWTNKAFYQIVSEEFNFGVKSCKSYVKLFFDLVKGRHGRFTIMENPDIYQITLESGDKAIESKIKNNIKPLVLIQESEDEIIYHTDSILFKNAIFESHIHVKKDGSVALTNEKLLYEDVLVSLLELELDTSNLYNEIKELERTIMMQNNEETANNIIEKSYNKLILKELKEDIEKAFMY